MKALTYQGPLDISYRDVPDPTPRDVHGAVVQVTACGICGSDLHIYEGHGFSADLGFCVGHESVGTIVETGSGVTGFSVGDRVMLPGSVGCGTCGACRANRVFHCEVGEAGCYGLSNRLPGSQAEAVAVPFADTNLVRLPDDISDDVALLLTDNAPTAWYGARRARIQPGQTVAVVGLGPVGLCAVTAAQLMGAARVLAIDLVPERRARAAAMGAEPMEGDDPVAAVHEATGGRGADVVLEAVGADATILLSIELVKRAGAVSVVGVNQNPALSINMLGAQVKELEFHIGLCSVQYELTALLPLAAAGLIPADQIISHHMPLSAGVDAYRQFHARQDGISKVVLHPGS